MRRASRANRFRAWVPSLAVFWDFGSEEETLP